MRNAAMGKRARVFHNAATKVTGLVLAVAFLTLLCAHSSAEAFQFVLPEAKEPSQEALIAATGANPKDPKALVDALWKLIRQYPGAVDADFHQRIVKGEREWLQNEVYARGAVDFGKPGQSGDIPNINSDLIGEIVKELEERRLHDPGRQIAALLRGLESVGVGDWWERNKMYLGPKAERRSQ